MKAGLLALGMVVTGVAGADTGEGAELDLEVEGAWVRVLPPTQSNSAAYLTLFNSSDSEQVVQSATSAIAQRVEIHTTREVDGMVRMEQLDGLRIAAGERVDLAPGGIHLMLLELAAMPSEGETITLCLQLASGKEVCTVATAFRTPPDGTGGGHSHQHHH